MTNVPKAIAGVAVTALALAFLPATAAHARKAHAAASYVLTITTETGQQSLATLECRPAGGTHPYKRKACVQLNTAGGHIEAVPPADGYCTMQYAPVTVRAEGFWHGTYYEYDETFPNRCVAVLETGGHLFKF